MPDALLLVVSTALYAAAAIGATERGRRIVRISPTHLLWGAVAASGGLVALRWATSGAGPFLTLYDVLVSNLFTLGLIVAVGASVAPVTTRGHLPCLSIIVLLGAWSFIVPDTPSILPASYDSPWLWAHVLTGKMFLGCLLVAMGMAWRVIVTRSVKVAPSESDAAIWQLTAIAFAFESAMLVTGAIWAQDAWGRYWAWDPVETWALLTWLVIAIGLHAKATLRMSARVGASIVLVSFCLAFVTIFGVPFFSAGPHAGAF